MRTWLVNGTTPLGNGMEMLRTKVSRPLRTTGSMPFRR
ncbi:hypothetical protein PVAP13_4NG125853 [Panicum virgatum]|uniref:Uncharacterized protein n=1 Tax=Panicum virgatum TaxID=38727 RepID=A0A8T0T625_PANVG|nr:hypothetical protein PVAP13_9KG570901 [Panicum virgatum]KAG2604675.1 hypothetical protein PVAP13_4NG125853 [Panicum virgatum]